MEQAEYGGEAYAKLIWTSPSTAPEIVPRPQRYPHGPQTSTVRGVGSGRCMDIQSTTPTDGSQLIIYDCHGDTNQQWIRT